MEISGKLFCFGRNIAIECADLPTEDILSLVGKDVRLTTEKVKIRSLTSNAYFHMLIGKMADILGISKSRCKNIELGMYGQREVDEYGNWQIISAKDGIDLMEWESVHFYAIGSSSVGYTDYAIIRPSHTYSQAEMNALLLGTVADAKELGIETMTENEIRRLNALWKSET